MKYSTITLLPLFAILGKVVIAQETRPSPYALKRTVGSEADGRRLYGANVILNSGQIGTVTASSSAFGISGINEGKYNLRVSFMGYNDFDCPIIFDLLQTINVNITLSSAYKYDAKTAHDDITNGKPQIFIFGGIAPIQNQKVTYVLKRGMVSNIWTLDAMGLQMNTWLNITA